MRFVDLHIHSHFSSDGEWSPERIVFEAVHAGAGAISISDHDGVGAVPIARETARGEGLELVPSVEISTSYRGKDYHLLAPLVDTDHPDLAALFEQQRTTRVRRAKERTRKLQECGFDVDYESVIGVAETDAPVGSAIAGAIFKLKRPKNDPLLEEFRDQKSPPIALYRAYLELGRPAYVALQEAPLETTIALVRRLGGVPTLAHPGAPFIRATLELVSDLREHGLEGLEVYSSYHDEAQTDLYETWARKLNLVATAGSDFHGRMKPHVPFASVRKRGMDLINELRERRERQ